MINFWVALGNLQINQKKKLKFLNRPYQIKFLESLVEMSGSSHTSTNNRKLLSPSEIKKSNVMVENILQVLVNTFLRPFHDELEPAKLYNIVSGQPAGDSIKEILLSLGGNW